MTFTLENCRMLPGNARKIRDSKTSSYIGVSITPYNRYRACIRYSGNYAYLGTFDTQEEAAHVRDSFIKRKGLDAKLNFPNE